MPPAVLMSSSERSCLFSAPSTWSWVTSWRSASRSFLSLSRSSLASSVDPNHPNEVAHRLDDAVRALLDRREHLHRTALDAVQTA